MMVISIVLLVLITLIIWLLHAPIIIRVDTTRSIYEIQVKGWLKTSFGLDEEGLVIDSKVPFYRFKIHPLKKGESKAVTEQKKSKKRPSFKLNRVKNIIRSFQVKILEVSLDTGDYVTNAQLFPVCFFLSRNNVSLSVNFRDFNHLRFEVQNSLWRMGTAYLNIRRY